MKRFLTILASIALLASCSINIDTIDEGKDTKAADSVAVSFGLYMNRSTSTKAGLTGELTTDHLKGDGGGFGVFGYYGNGVLYNETSKPDFMYNQKVEFKTIGGTSVWTYEPIKYWPNEFGEAASSEAADRLTFFAYAPYAAVTPSTGLVTGDANSGIIGMTRNIAAGDPMVMYEANLVPGNGVDLCWGVAADDFTSSVNGGQNHVEKGAPFLNVIKPKTGDRIAFDFNHALAQLNVQIDTDIDVESHAGEELANDGTRIYVRSVTFSGFALRGSLNLNSNTTSGPAWFDISGTGRVKRDPVTVHDGRTDGIEGMTTAADPNETPAGLNPAIIQTQPYDAAVLDGVKHTAVNLFDVTGFTGTQPEAAPIMVVPTSGVPLKVTIVYDVETADPKLLGYVSDGVTRGVSVENVITKNVMLSNGSDMILQAGKRYVVNLHLGLTSVKMDAEVKTWLDGDSSNTDVPANTTAIGTVELSSGGNPLTDVTVWKNQASLAAPDVTVKDLSGNPIPDATISWASDNTSVATVDTDGSVTLCGVSGTAEITATATREGRSGSAAASYHVYVNEVTGISVSPATTYVGPAGNVTLTATLTHTGLGTVGTLPTISWVSGSTEYVTVSPSTGNSTQATGVAEGSSTITASIDEAYMETGVSASASATVNCRNTLNMAFRGYWVSPGILYRDNAGNYGLTNERDGSGFNVFETISLYGQQSSYDLNQGQYTYYLRWPFLKGDDELGADGNNIKADSSKLPSGWRLPYNSTWETILFGEPKTPVYVNGTQLHGKYYYSGSQQDQYAGAYAFARVDAGNSTYYNGILLFRDGTSVTCAHLDTEHHKVGTKAAYEDNTLTMDDYTALANNGCQFIPVTGYYSSLSGFGWRDREEGYYYTANVESSGKPYFLVFDSNFQIGCAFSTGYASNHIPIRLIRPATSPL